jgi:hypothetical protein
MRFESGSTIIQSATQQGAAQPLSVGFGNEPAAGGSSRQNSRCCLEAVQLLGRAPGAIDLQFVADGMNLHDEKLSKDRVEDLGQAKARLATDSETSDRLALQLCLISFSVTPASIRCAQNRERW